MGRDGRKKGTFCCNFIMIGLKVCIMKQFFVSACIMVVYEYDFFLYGLYSQRQGYGWFFAILLAHSRYLINIIDFN